MLRRLWNLNPLWLVGAVCAVQLAYVFPLVALVVVLSYFQNATYGLQSRAANRNNNAYHLLAAVAASFVFFANLRILMNNGIGNEIPLTLFAPYVFATIFGSLHGNTISIAIEKALGITVGDPKGKAQWMKLWPSIAVLCAILTIQLVALQGHRAELSKGGGWITLSLGTLLLLTFLAAFDGFAFAVLRLARSTDHYWFHLATVLVQTGAAFLRLAIMIKLKMDWALFLPSTTGSVIGGLIGANYGQVIASRIKAAFDAHVTSEKSVSRPTPQLALLSLGVVAQLVLFGVNTWTAGLLLLGLAFAQAASFTLVSRARQRGNQQFLAWASVFSNGIWYLTMHRLALHNIGLDKALPYIIGNSAGSLIGQQASMVAERATGALMDEPQQAKPAVA